MIGAPGRFRRDSFGSGGYQGTKIEQIMPVRFDAQKMRQQPDIALMLVIDRSGSMQGPKIEAAKESAQVTTEVLSPNDVIGVVAFDSEAQVFVRPQRAANKMRISAEIARLQSAGGTNIYPGLREAFELLQGINAKVKHVILLSDGEAPYDGIVDLVQDMRAARITVTAVGVTGADRNLPSLIADNGDGRLYMTDDIGAARSPARSSAGSSGRWWPPESPKPRPSRRSPPTAAARSWPAASAGHAIPGEPAEVRRRPPDWP